MDPVADIKQNRNLARSRQDANADICFLSLASADGQASIRTLVMRDIVDNRFSILINKSSPKWEVFSDGGSYQLLLWYPSVQRQYRISGDHRELAADIVKSHWQKRPVPGKYMDILYQTLAPQSSTIASRDKLAGYIREIEKRVNLEEMEAPDKVAGVELIATRIEILDLARADRIHDRQLYSWNGRHWTSQILIP